MTHKKGHSGFFEQQSKPPSQGAILWVQKEVYNIYYYKDQNPQKLLDWKAKMEPNSLFTKKRRDSNLVFFSFFAFTFKRFWKKEPGVEPPEDLGGRESFTRSSSEKQQMWRSKYKWSIRQNRHMQYLLIFPSFPEENESGKREDVVSEMRVRPYQCHAVDSVNSTLLSLSQQPFCLFVLFWSDTQAH